MIKRLAIIANLALTIVGQAQGFLSLVSLMHHVVHHHHDLVVSQTTDLTVSQNHSGEPTSDHDPADHDHDREIYVVTSGQTALKPSLDQIGNILVLRSDPSSSIYQESLNSKTLVQGLIRPPILS